MNGVEASADSGHGLQGVRAFRDERAPRGRVADGSDAQASARRVQVGSHQDRVLDHLHLVDRPHPGGDRQQRAVGEPEQRDVVGVHEVPRGQHGEAAALAGLHRAPAVLVVIVPEDPAGRGPGADPVLVDGVPVGLFAGGRLTRLGTGGVEEPRRVGTPGDGTVVGATQPVGEQRAGLDVEDADHRAVAAAAGPPERHQRAVGRRHGAHQDVTGRPGAGVEHRFERGIGRAAHDEHGLLGVGTGPLEEGAPVRARGDRRGRPCAAGGTGDGGAETRPSRDAVEHGAGDGLLGGRPGGRLGVVRLLHPDVRVVEAPAVQGEAAVGVAAGRWRILRQVRAVHRAALPGSARSADVPGAPERRSRVQFWPTRSWP